MGALRHRDPLKCSMSALAMYLFSRWQIGSEMPPNFTSRKAWYDTKLLAGQDPFQEISWRQQYDDITQIFALCGIDSGHITHAPRISGTRSAELHGVSEKQVSFLI
jgi:hypothetical protein